MKSVLLLMGGAVLGVAGGLRVAGLVFPGCDEVSKRAEAMFWVSVLILLFGAYTLSWLSIQ